MSFGRAIALLLFVFGVSLLLVDLQVQKVRERREIVQLEERLRQLNYQRWQNQAGLAQLCSPGELEERSNRMALGTIPPKVVGLRDEGGERLAGR